MTDELEDRITLGTDAHANNPNENPMAWLGEVIPDPWDDLTQTDWATGALNMDDDGQAA